MALPAQVSTHMGPAHAQESFRQLLRDGQMEKRSIKIDASGARSPVTSMEGLSGFHEVMIKVDKLVGPRGHGGEKRDMTVAEARPLVQAQEEERLINNDTVSPCPPTPLRHELSSFEPASPCLVHSCTQRSAVCEGSCCWMAASCVASCSYYMWAVLNWFRTSSSAL